MNRRHSLKKSAEFQRVRSLKRSWAHPLLVLYAAPGGHHSVRVGIVAGKRTGKAVARNRIKRLVREAVRAMLPTVVAGNDLVFVARPAAGEAAFAQVRCAVESLLLRSRLIPRRGTPAILKSSEPPLLDGRSAAGLAPEPATQPDKHEMDRTASD